MTSVKLMLNKDRAHRDGTYPVVFQIIHCRKKKLVYTPYSLYREEFNENTGKVFYVSSSVRPRKEVDFINNSLSEQFEKIRKVISRIGKDGEYSVCDIVSRFRDCKGYTDILSYFRLKMDIKRQNGCFGTASALKSTMLSLSSYIGGDRVSINRIDTAFVKGYEEYLMRRGISRNTICYYMRNFRSVYNSAVMEGCVPDTVSPFQYISSSPCVTLKRAINEDSLRRLLEADFSDDLHLDMARDLFMFSFFSRGMPFVDVIFLKKSNISDGVITYRRHKTGQKLQVSVTPYISMLIDKYRNPSEYVFPILEGTSPSELHVSYRLALERTNRNLKNVASRCGITLSLTTYMARHSWATRAMNLGIPLPVISESLGHTSEKTTRIYLKELDRRILDEANAMVSDLRSI